ncbi:MAG: hypothetical protein IPH12_11495 [Saprospirales bacterium]|nr:hypothetical protein [Saprospirales bacterium]MBK8919947.1 hypothetical protein [Saprospirales bacterium]
MCGRITCFLLFGFFTLLLQPACEDETKNNKLMLAGRWEIVEGYRNQQRTETLAGTYFQFWNDGKMITNLPVGPEEQVEYELRQTHIRQKSTPPVEYQILTLSDTVLVLGLELRGMQFEMRFQRAAVPQAQPEPESLPVQDSSDTSLPDSTRE